MGEATHNSSPHHPLLRNLVCNASELERSPPIRQQHRNALERFVVSSF